MNVNELEKLYSQCKHSSDWDEADPKPRSCSLKLFNGTPVWQQCGKCTQFTQENEENSHIQDVVKVLSKQQGKKGCQKCQQKKMARESSKIFPAAPKKSEGLGDTVEKVARFFGFKKCSACERRRKALNKKVPYGK
jgi:hypothetical protein